MVHLALCIRSKVSLLRSNIFIHGFFICTPLTRKKYIYQLLWLFSDVWYDVIGELKGIWAKVDESVMAYFKILSHHTLSGMKLCAYNQ
jgi:hypothetical protein